jgi:hypothetical protein
VRLRPSLGVKCGICAGAGGRPALYVRLNTTRPLGMVFISYFGEWA